VFIVLVLHSADLGLTAALLNNRTKTLLWYDFITQSNNHDLDDIFTKPLTSINTNYWLPVRWKVHILPARKKSLFYDPALSRLNFSGKIFTSALA